MKLENGTFCPLVQGACKKLECTFFLQVRGTNPQTGQEIDEWDCAIKWLPVLLIENAKEVRQGAAATESFRNEMVRMAQARPTAVFDIPQKYTTGGELPRNGASELKQIT